MFESLEDRKFMSVTLPTVNVTDGTSNTIMVGEAATDTTSARKAGKEQHEYLIIKMNDVIITGVT
jgi:hypothetical protein